VGDAGDDLALDVGQDLGEGLAPLRRGRGEGGPQLPRAEARQYGKLLPLGQVAGDPVDETAAFVPKDLEIDVPGQRATPRW
jgi:hypothetical protein